MQVGDLVTYKQRIDLQEFPCLWHRLGIILDIDTAWINPNDYRCEVYWYASGDKVWWEEAELEIAQ